MIRSFVLTFALLQSSAPRVMPVVVLDRADTARPVLEAAEHEAARLFAQIGVTLTWPADVPSGRFLRLCIDRVPTFTERELTDGTLGLAVSTSVAYVFTADADRFSRLYGTPTTQIIGVAIAHELAHLLIPPPGHASTGIMKAKWTAADFNAATLRRFAFDDRTAAAIRLAISGPR